MSVGGQSNVERFSSWTIVVITIFHIRFPSQVLLFKGSPYRNLWQKWKTARFISLRFFSLCLSLRYPLALSLRKQKTNHTISITRCLCLLDKSTFFLIFPLYKIHFSALIFRLCWLSNDLSPFRVWTGLFILLRLNSLFSLPKEFIFKFP